MKEFVYHGKSCPIEKALSALPGVSYASVRKVLRKRDVKINGVRAGENAFVGEGDRVVAYFPETDIWRGRILYEDDRVVVVNKPKQIETLDAAAALAERYGGIYAVHRLDRNTDGVMIFARDTEAKELLERAFRCGATDKRYRALVVGRMTRDADTMTAYLVKNAAKATVRIADAPVAGALPIKTGYRVLARNAETTLIEVRLYTGRTHQIRAHLAHIGHPIVGDGKYGDSAFNRRAGKRFQELTCVCLNVRPEGSLAYLADMTFVADALPR